MRKTAANRSRDLETVFEVNAKRPVKTGLLQKTMLIRILHYTKRSTLPERRQRVHTYFLTGAPFSTTLTRCTLGAHFLLEIL